MGTRDTIQKLRPPLPVPCGEPWGTLYLRVMGGDERDAFTRLWKAFAESKEDDTANLYAALLVRTLADENGKREYKDDEVSQLATIDAKLQAKLFNEALTFNRLQDDAVADSKKGSGVTGNGEHGSDSPATST